MIMAKALVTGARGFIGSLLCKRLIASGIEVHAVSRNPPASAKRWRAVAGDMGATQANAVQWWKADLVELEKLPAIWFGPFGRDAPHFTWRALSQARATSRWSRPVFDNLVTTFNLLTATAEANTGESCSLAPLRSQMKFNQRPARPMQPRNGRHRAMPGCFTTIRVPLSSQRSLRSWPRSI